MWKCIAVTVGEKIGKQHLTYAQGACAEPVAMAAISAADDYPQHSHGTGTHPAGRGAALGRPVLPLSPIDGIRARQRKLFSLLPCSRLHILLDLSYPSYRLQSNLGWHVTCLRGD